jgi:hypothetical protein
MNMEQKAQRYNYLLGEHTKISNQIQSIKGESIDLNSSQQQRISVLNNQLLSIMNEIQGMM